MSLNMSEFRRISIIRSLAQFYFDTSNDKISNLIPIALRLLISVAFILAAFGVFEPAAYSQQSSDKVKEIKIKKVDQWRYLMENRELPHKWRHLGFKHSTWRKGQGNFGYGDVDVDNRLPNIRGKNLRIYVRGEFTVNPRRVEKIDLSAICDGPFKAYLNGILVARSNIRWTEEINLTGFRHEMFAGNNILAIECINENVWGNKFFFAPSMTITEK